MKNGQLEYGTEYEDVETLSFILFSPNSQTVEN